MYIFLLSLRYLRHQISDIRYQILLNVELISSIIKLSEEAAQTKAKKTDCCLETWTCIFSCVCVCGCGDSGRHPLWWRRRLFLEAHSCKRSGRVAGCFRAFWKRYVRHQISDIRYQILINVELIRLSEEAAQTKAKQNRLLFRHVTSDIRY